MTGSKSVFETLNSINVGEHIEQKNGLSYLSWAWAWAECKKAYPEAFYTIYENENGWNYFTDGKTCWVKTGVTIEGLEHIEYLPVMDFRNKSIMFDVVTSFDVNKAIQRSLTKALARHGLGLYIYAGEDLPEADAAKKAQQDIEDEAKAKAELLAKITEVVSTLKENGIDQKMVCTLYKVKNPKELDMKKCENILKHIPELKQKQEEAKNE